MKVANVYTHTGDDIPSWNRASKRPRSLSASPDETAYRPDNVVTSPLAGLELLAETAIRAARSQAPRSASREKSPALQSVPRPTRTGKRAATKSSEAAPKRTLLEPFRALVRQPISTAPAGGQNANWYSGARHAVTRESKEYLGDMYRRGDRIPQNLAAARILYAQAATPGAMVKQTRLLLSGSFGPVDMAVLRNFARKELNTQETQSYLAAIYARRATGTSREDEAMSARLADGFSAELASKCLRITQAALVHPADTADVSSRMAEPARAVPAHPAPLHAAPPLATPPLATPLHAAPPLAAPPHATPPLAQSAPRVFTSSSAVRRTAPAGQPNEQPCTNQQRSMMEIIANRGIPFPVRLRHLHELLDSASESPLPSTQFQRLLTMSNSLPITPKQSRALLTKFSLAAARQLDKQRLPGA